MNVTSSDIVAQAQLKRLRGSGVSINEDSVIENYVSVEYKDYLDSISNEKDREKKKKEIIKWYKEGDGSTFMSDAISKLKDYAQKAKESLENLTTSATKTLSMSAVPAVITVGSASSSPNPAYTILDGSSKKNSLLTILKTTNDYLIKIMELAILIHWAIPESVLNMVELLATLTNLINSIPG